jgi:hypothetical protein
MVPFFDGSAELDILELLVVVFGITGAIVIDGQALLQEETDLVTLE